MSINPIDDNTTPRNTGSLEELFRHHLGEEAAVPPRPMLWDQIDNSLLIRQNETYRRRLTATRWVAAASLFLATLAGTGWWSTRDSGIGNTDMAKMSQTQPASSSAAGRMGTAVRNGNQANGVNGNASQAAAVVATTGAEATGTKAAVNGSQSRFGTTGTGTRLSTQPAALAANSATRSAGFGAAAVRNGMSAATTAATAAGQTFGAKAVNSTTEATNAANQSLAARSTQASATGTKTLTNPVTTTATPAFDAPEAVAAGGTPTSATAGSGALASTAPAPPTALAQAGSVAALEQTELLAARTTALNLEAPAALPNGLAKVTLPEVPVEDIDAHRWHYGATYTAGVFNPNINFSRAGIEPEYGYNPALGSGSPALTETAATQYRQNLRPGLSQRIALLATRHLAGHWSLSTGAEFSQATAKSASSMAFVGEQLPDLGQSGTGPLHTTDFRYRMASIPVEIRYTNPVKRGWSLYGRLGGVVSALLGVRSEVEGNPEATKTYSIASAGTPYRRVLGSLRGGAGAQYRAGTGKWALTLGPVAEIGLSPLNAHPAQSLFSQSRAYSFGMEAGMEFGR